MHPTEGQKRARPEATAPGPSRPAQVSSDAGLAAEVATLRDAIATRTIIGQATGLLAGQLNITTPMAWRVMRRLSNETNIKLRDIARALVDAHDGRRSPGDDGVARAIGAALSPALAAARDSDDPDDPHDPHDPDGPDDSPGVGDDAVGDVGDGRDGRDVDGAAGRAGEDVVSESPGPADGPAPQLRAHR